MTDAIELAAGGATTCAVTSNLTLSCWGFRPRSEDGSAAPERVVQLEARADLEVSGEHACLRRERGEVACWGRNVFGSLGTEAPAALMLPTVLETIDAAADLSVGAYHACIATRAGRVQCWGDNQFGQLGNGEVDPLPEGDEG